MLNFYNCRRKIMAKFETETVTTYRFKDDLTGEEVRQEEQPT